MIEAMVYGKSQKTAAIGVGITRAASWLDHSALGITAGFAAFQNLSDQALHARWLAQWAPGQPCRTQSLFAALPWHASDAAAASTAFAAHKTTLHAARRLVA